jgi:hypothetical protein
MEIDSELFVETNDSISEKIITKIKKGEWNEVLNSLCDIKNNKIIIDYIYFKYFATKETYNIILALISKNIDTILSSHNTFSVYINMKSLTMVEIDKHKFFIQHIASILKEKYPSKLGKCYIYNAPFVFSQFFNIICLFVDKETISKIELVK